MSDLQQELDFAREAARAAGKIALSHFGRSIERKQKPDGSWATEADWSVEAQIRLRIARAFPDHNVLGEENGLSASGGGAARDGAPTWIVDPIDGTHNYMAGIPVWATLIALQIDDERVLGVVHAPALNETYEAASGSGARFNGAPIRVSDASLDAATLVFSNWSGLRAHGMREGFEAVADKVWRVRGFGDFWGHMLVARGAAHVMIEPELSLWDVAALEPIVKEAGGTITGLDGSPWTKGACITSNDALHPEVLELLRGPTG